jgi:DNA-binding MarR family transcriptional regulator
MPGQPSLTQMVGRAESAFGVLLSQVLTPLGGSFHHWVCLSLLAANGGTLDGDDLSKRITGALKVDQTLVTALVKDLAADGLLRGEVGAGDIVLTRQGRERFDELRQAIETATSYLYDGLADDEIATTTRVLEHLTAQADARIRGQRT